MANPKQAKQPAPVATDLEGAVRHLCMAIVNLTNAVERSGQNVSVILESVRQDAGAAIECLTQQPLQFGDAPGGVERTAAQIAAADAANQSDPDNVS